MELTEADFKKLVYRIFGHSFESNEISIFRIWLNEFIKESRMDIIVVSVVCAKWLGIKWRKTARVARVEEIYLLKND